MEPALLTAPEIVALMRQAVPPGKETLDDPSLTRLRELTGELLEAKPDAQQDMRGSWPSANGPCRCRTTSWTPGCAARPWSWWAHRLHRFQRSQQVEIHVQAPVSVGRGVTDGYPRLPGAEYLQADIRDRARSPCSVRSGRMWCSTWPRSVSRAGRARVHRTLSTTCWAPRT